jgi:hypothetical protein
MFQFDIKLFTLQLLSLKTDVFLTIQQRTKFYESHSYLSDVIGPMVENKNESRGKWRPIYFILFRK